MTTLRVSRTARIPDELRIERCRRLPEFGPRLLFFSGGSALRGLSRKLKLHTQNSAHLITPFDSGGSSALLRETFGMPSVGDLRNRLMALADETTRGSPEIYRLFSHRFPVELSRPGIEGELQSMVSGTHPLVANVPGPLRRIVRTHLRVFMEQAPNDFDLSGASIGNLILAGGYLHNERDIESVLFMFSQLVEVRGRVVLTTDANLHLRATLADGTHVVGQHLLTGKESSVITAPVVELGLVTSLTDPRPGAAEASSRALRLIERADQICFPIGSFYSSVLANLLPRGIGAAVAAAGAPKIYVPNTARDPEQLGLGMVQAVERIWRTVRRDAGEETPLSSVVQFVLLDASDAAYPDPPDVEGLRRLGVEVLRTPLVTRESAPRMDPLLLCEALVSIA